MSSCRELRKSLPSLDHAGRWSGAKLEVASTSMANGIGRLKTPILAHVPLRHKGFGRCTILEPMPFRLQARVSDYVLVTFH